MQNFSTLHKTMQKESTSIVNNIHQYMYASKKILTKIFVMFLLFLLLLTFLHPFNNDAEKK